tara:strand:- start:789 stop:1007 length:219 start_codon:yes stop_codon:yes gene_type:complete
MNNYEDDSLPTLYPPDIIASRMEQVRLLVMEMDLDFPEQYRFLEKAALLLLESCSLTEGQVKDYADNITKIH